MSRRAGALVTLVAVATLARPALADGVKVHGVAAAAKAFGGHQERELGPGAVGLAALELPIAPALGAQLEVGALWLSAGETPEDPRFEAQGDASATHVAGGLRVNPVAGLWLAAAAGPTRTGGQTRALADAQVGWDFFFHHGRFGVGPVIGWAHVFQPDSELRPADANVVFAGVHAVWDPDKGPKPDGDRDRDGIKDSVDRCPDDPEDKDGFQDEDGCPDRDNDGDGILDAIDRCPLVPEDADGFEDADGCPDPDNDRDGILDPKDACPNEPEDKDGFEDEDGCPDPDNDQDGILDPKDACPNEPETKNGYADEDGCPDSEQVRVTGDKIVLDDRVHFWTNSARIRPASYPLLERVAKLILSQPSYAHIEVQGHTDERGPAWFNQKLSDDRAQSVLEFLVKQGLERSRLSSRGFGATVPLVEKKSERAWFMNRRVEFAITRETRSVERAGGKP
ncbi:MAG: OmpA family protein [Polyangiaceae bacterium]|nr:OmpA family protein [Polyangiaceae bacterium]